MPTAVIMRKTAPEIASLPIVDGQLIFNMTGKTILMDTASGERLQFGGFNVVDTLTSTSDVDALSANQGRVLNEGKVNYDDIVDSVTDVNPAHALSAPTGKYLNEEITKKVAKTDIVNNLTTESPNLPLSANMGKWLGDNKVSVSSIVDGLASTATTAPLSANQGRVLNQIKVNSSDIVNNLTTPLATVPLSAAQGKVLQDSKVAYNDVIDNLSTTYTRSPLSANMGVYLENKKLDRSQVVNNLSSQSASNALSANMGFYLNNIKQNVLTLQVVPVSLRPQSVWNIKNLEVYRYGNICQVYISAIASQKLTGDSIDICLLPKPTTVVQAYSSYDGSILKITKATINKAGYFFLTPETFADMYQEIDLAFVYITNE